MRWRRILVTNADSTRIHERIRLEASHDRSVAWLVMERGDGPANAFSAPMVDAMAEAVGVLSDWAGCLVLRGQSEFSVGADLAAIRETPAELRPATIEGIAAASNRFIRTIRDLDIPAVAAVNGTAAGGGLGFALACDVILMHADAVFDPAYARIGLSPDNATPFFLARTLGPYRARDLLFAPRPMDAEEAAALGLASQVIEGDMDGFDESVGAIAADYAAQPVNVLASTKTLVETALTDSLDDHLERERETIRHAAASPIFTEGLAAFFEDRPPDWPASIDDSQK